MYDIRQFKPALYALLLMGMTGFALAAEWPGLWVLSVGGIILNAWLVRTNRFTPMPRFLASIVTIIAFIYIADLVFHSTTTPILIIGQFLVLLQLVKLYEQRANRDWAQLIILSLLLMVAAAINTASLVFGIMFICYLFLSLYVCLLFHLKVESEGARKAIALPEIEPNPATLRQDQRYLSSSMRRLTVLISIVAVLMAVNIFLFFPRGTGANLLGPLQFKASRALTGFSEQIGFQQVARITQNTAHVADVQVFHNGKLTDGTQSLYLRGLTLDFYNGENIEPRWGRSAYQWIRLLPAGRELIIDRDEDDAPIPDAPTSQGEETWRQKISLQPTGSQILFAMAGPVSVSMSRHGSVRYSAFDQSISNGDSPTSPIAYEVVSNGKIPYKTYPPDVQRPWRPWNSGQPDDRPTSSIDPKIREYVKDPQVSGIGPQNVPLLELRRQALERIKQANQRIQASIESQRAAAQELSAKIEAERDPTALARLNEQREAALKVRLKSEADLLATGPDGLYDPPTIYDAAIAAAVEHHLHTKFQYTLDLTDVNMIAGQDPMMLFLTDFKRGHCEYFAGAMTLMMQSIGVPARVVVGFRCDDYNSIGQFYNVQQNHAHAWVETRVVDSEGAPARWQTYDPTSGREVAQVRSVSLMRRVRNLFDYLEHTWANNVIAYDRGSRDNLVQNLETKLTTTAVNSGQKVAKIPDWVRVENWQISSWLLTILIIIACLALIGSIGWYFWERWRMRKRAARIGLDALPTDERLRMARQLGFYDDLMRLLERRGHVRPRHLTPMEFSDSLTFLPAEGFDAIRRITEVFYRIRYGRHELSPAQRDKLNHTIGQIEGVLGPI